MVTVCFVVVILFLNVKPCLGLYFCKFFNFISCVLRIAHTVGLKRQTQ